MAFWWTESFNPYPPSGSHIGALVADLAMQHERKLLLRN
jgi:hypothetical protein